MWGTFIGTDVCGELKTKWAEVCGPPFCFVEWASEVIVRGEGGGERAYRYLTCKLSERLTELQKQPLNHHSLAPDVTRQCLVVCSLLRAKNPITVLF